MFKIVCPCCTHENPITTVADLMSWVGRKGAYPYVAAYVQGLAHGPRLVSDLAASPPPGSSPRGGHMRYEKQRVLISRANMVIPSITDGEVALFATQRIRATNGDPLVFLFATPGSRWETLSGMGAHNEARDAYLASPTSKRVAV